MLTHNYPANETFIQHSGGTDCKCAPTVRTVYKAQASGRGGRKQGYNTSEKVVTHNATK